MKELIKLEIKKNFLQKKVFIVLMVLICMKIVMSIYDNAPYPSGVDVSIYKEYVDILEGPHDKEKLEFINSEIKRYDELRNNEDVYIAKYRAGEISVTEFRAIKKDIDKSNDVISTLYYLQAKSYYYENSYPQGEYYYDLDNDRYFMGLNIDYSALLFVLFIVALLFVTDDQAKTSVLVKSSKYGGRTLLNIRLVILVIMTIIVSIVFQMIEFVVKYNTLELVGFDKSIKSMLSFMEYSFDTTVFGMLGILFITRMVFLIFISIIAVAIAYIAKNAMGIMAAGLIIVVIPEFVFNTLPNWINYALPTMGYNGITLYNSLEKILGLQGYLYAYLCNVIFLIVTFIFIENQDRQS